MPRLWIRCIVLTAAIGFSAPVSAQGGDKDAAGPASEPLACPVQLAGRDNPTAFPTEPFECHCTAAARKLRGGYAFGSGPYDGISNICMAALHAGATGPDGGGVRVVPRPVQKSFTGSLANGVFSSDWDSRSQFGSFDVESASGQ